MKDPSIKLRKLSSSPHNNILYPHILHARTTVQTTQAHEFADKRLIAHPLVSQSSRSSKPQPQKAGPVESAKSAAENKQRVSASFSFTGAAQGFAPKQTVRAGLRSMPSAIAGTKRHHEDNNDMNPGAHKKKKKKKKKKKNDDAARFSFK